MKTKTTPPKKSEPGILIFLVVALLLTITGLFLGDARGVLYKTFGGIHWFAVFIVSFTFGLLFFAQFVLPIRGAQGWSEGFYLIWRHYSAPGQRFLKRMFGLSAKPEKKPASTKSRRRKKEPPKTDPLQLPASFTALKAGILSSHHVLALVKGSQFARPAGPGFVMLDPKEKVSHLIDLRKQLRRQPVKASTRDGIPVETAVTVIFRVRQQPIEFLGPEPYPYDDEAIFHIAYHQSIDEKDTVRGWMDQIAPRAAALLADEIPRYTLDELYRPGSGGISPLDQIKTRIKQQLDRQLDPNGIELLVVAADPFALPEGVVAQRIKTWQADWMRKIALQQAAGSAEAVRRIKRARARAQIEIIQNITQNIAAVRQAEGTDLTNIITLRMIEALEEAQSSAPLKALVPQQVMSSLVMDTSQQMQSWLHRKKDLGA